jgi:putative hydrolases of HD superfamily
MVGRSRRGPDPLVGFFTYAGLLKAQPRRGWVLKLGMKNPESVADHSYRTAVMAMVYADARGLDGARAVKMALIHDLPESIVGDLTPGEISAEEKRARETAAMKRISLHLPAKVRGEYLGLWEEFSRGESREARLVRQLDKLEMALQAAEYRDPGMGPAVEEFFETAREAMGDGYLRATLEAISGTRAVRNRVRRRPSGSR